MIEPYGATSLEPEEREGLRFMHIETRAELDRMWIDHGTWPSAELALRFHHRLVWIHLFPNGNGRHARILCDALSVHELETTPIRWGGGALQFDGGHRDAYIKALRAADGDNMQPLLDLFAEC